MLQRSSTHSNTPIKNEINSSSLEPSPMHIRIFAELYNVEVTDKL